MKNYSFRLLRPYNAEAQSLNEPAGMANSIFLAGPCPRHNYEDDWRFEAFDILDELGFTGTVITPTNDQYNEMERHEPEALWAQTEWERACMYMCSALVFWVPRSEEHPAYTTNIEFGEWYKKTGVYFGFPEEALRMKYLTLKMSEQKKSWYSNLRGMLADVVADLQCKDKTPKKWFTSDTHFTQQRTLELSRRPFVDVTEMDLTMISNWNKNVRPNDIVYHAGDFVDYTNFDRLKELLGDLNFGTLHWVLGNYDRNYAEQIRDIAEVFNQCHAGYREIIIYDQADDEQMCLTGLTDSEGKTHEYVIVHEPYDLPAPYREGAVYLYGHIHGRSFAKYNGFDIGTDYHNYTPLSEDQVLWFTNAMQYWDKNVYTNTVKTDLSVSKILDVYSGDNWTKPIEAMLDRLRCSVDGVETVDVSKVNWRRSPYGDLVKLYLSKFSHHPGDALSLYDIVSGLYSLDNTVFKPKQWAILLDWCTYSGTKAYATGVGA